MERIASVSCPFSFLLFSSLCSVQRSASRCKRDEQGSDEAQGLSCFPWWVMLGAGAPVVRVATAAAPYGALPAHQARPHARCGGV